MATFKHQTIFKSYTDKFVLEMLQNQRGRLSGEASQINTIQVIYTLSGNELCVGYHLCTFSDITGKFNSSD